MNNDCRSLCQCWSSSWQIVGSSSLLVAVDNGKEILSMNEVLSYMLRSSWMLCEETELSNLLKYDETEWQNYVSEVRGMIVIYPGKVRHVKADCIIDLAEMFLHVLHVYNRE